VRYPGFRDRRNGCWRQLPYNSRSLPLRGARKLLEDLPGLQHLNRLLELNILLKRRIGRGIGGGGLRYGPVLLSTLFLSFAGLSRLVFPWHDSRLGLLLLPVLFTGLGLTRFGDRGRWLSFYDNIRRNPG